MLSEKQVCYWYLLSAFMVEFGAYEWKTMKETYDASEAVAKFLLKNDLCPRIQTEDGPFKFLALYAKNREEWIVADLGAMMTGITVVTLYDTLGKESIDYILNQTQIKTVVSSSDKLKTLLDLKREGKLPLMQAIIYFDEAKKEDLDAAVANEVKLYRYEDVISEGKGMKQELDEVTPDTVYTLCYTSGTTGMPKGAMLTHRNFCSNVGAMTEFDR